MKVVEIAAATKEGAKLSWFYDGSDPLPIELRDLNITAGSPARIEFSIEREILRIVAEGHTS
jgi:hypothetical protein